MRKLSDEEVWKLLDHCACDDIAPSNTDGEISDELIRHRLKEVNSLSSHYIFPYDVEHFYGVEYVKDFQQERDEKAGTLFGQFLQNVRQKHMKKFEDEIIDHEDLTDYYYYSVPSQYIEKFFSIAGKLKISYSISETKVNWEQKGITEETIRDILSSLYINCYTVYFKADATEDDEHIVNELTLGTYYSEKNFNKIKKFVEDMRNIGIIVNDISVVRNYDVCLHLK